MPFEVSTALRTWLTSHGLGGYLQVYDAEHHPRALAIATKIHPGTVTNDMLRTALRLQRGGDYDIEAPPQHILDKYFGEYSLSAKAHRTHGGPDVLFGDLAHFFLEYICLHLNPHSMPKKRAGLIILAYEGKKIDWGCITGDGIRAALASFKSGKRLLPVLAQYTTVLYPPGPQPARQQLALPPPPAKTQRRQVTHEEWTEDDDPTDSSTQVGDNITLRGQTQVIAPTNIFPLDTTSITTPRSGHQKRGRENVKTPPTTSSKRRHTEQEAPPQPALTQAVAVAADMTLATVPTQQEKGQSSQISEKDVFALRDMPAEAFELAALLQHGTTYELIDFLARLQVAAAARMATEHAERQVIERALDNEPASDDEPKLQRVGRKRALKKRRTRIELPELNTALVDTYKELDYATRAAKDMAANIKIARQQAKRATDLWHNSELQRAELEQQLTLAQTAPSTARLSCSTDATTQTETHPTDPVTPVPRLLSTATQTDPEDTLRIQQLEEEVASYKAITDKSKE